MSPSRFPDRVEVSEYLEPMILATIITPLEHVRQIMTVCQVWTIIFACFPFSRDQNHLLEIRAV